MSLEREIKDAKMSSFSSDFQTLIIKGQMNQNFDLFNFSSILVKCV